MGRIEDNEKRLDKLNCIVESLDMNLSEFENNIKDYNLLNKYYGSKEWFKDKSSFECGKIKDVKAGVLSEDAVWNLDENVKDLVVRMERIVNIFNNKK